LAKTFLKEEVYFTFLAEKEQNVEKSSEVFKCVIFYIFSIIFAYDNF